MREVTHPRNSLQLVLLTVAPRAGLSGESGVRTTKLTVLTSSNADEKIYGLREMLIR